MAKRAGRGGDGRRTTKKDNEHGGADSRSQLRSFVERIERLEEEKKTITDDIKDVYGEAKGAGFDQKQLKKVIAIRKMDPDERNEQEAILETYLAALGMLDYVPDDDMRDDGEDDGEGVV